MYRIGHMPASNLELLHQAHSALSIHIDYRQDLLSWHLTLRNSVHRLSPAFKKIEASKHRLAFFKYLAIFICFICYLCLLYLLYLSNGCVWTGCGHRWFMMVCLMCSSLSAC